MFLLATIAILPALRGWDETTPSEPRLLSVFPTVAPKGGRVRVELRGHDLAGVTQAWLDGAGIAGKLAGPAERLGSEESPARPEGDGKKPASIYRIAIDLDIGAQARPGGHWLRVVSPRGVSNAVRFDVAGRAVMMEDSAKQAGDLPLPVLINGKLERPGETDLYSFQAGEGRRYWFDVIAAENFDPRVGLLSSKKSWFDGSRPRRVLLDEERSFDLMPASAKGSVRTSEPGRYTVEVSSLFGKGCAGCSYQISISGEEGRLHATAPLPESWIERDFSRTLDDRWIQKIESRRGARAAMSPLAAVFSRERAGGEEPSAIASLPALTQGAIDHPGDVDQFRFKASTGQKLVFEIETPGTKPPHFNPRLAVLDSNGKQLFSNIQRRISLFNNNAETEVYLKDIQPRAVHTFTAGGEYVLQVRDLTSRYGNESYSYRVLIRPQIPHVGEVSSSGLDHINLTPGRARKVDVNAMLEEGFSGEVTYHASGLPPGVSMRAAGRIVEERAPRDLPENAETVLPVQYSATLVFSASRDADPSHEPALVTLECRPLVDGAEGPPLQVRRFPLMVVGDSGGKEKQP